MRHQTAEASAQRARSIDHWVYVLGAGWILLSGSRALPANLCPGLAGAEALCHADDFCESVGESVEARAGGAVRQGAAEHLQNMVGAG
jgi:hypothetical protein